MRYFLALLIFGLSSAWGIEMRVAKTEADGAETGGSYTTASPVARGGSDQASFGPGFILWNDGTETEISVASASSMTRDDWTVTWQAGYTEPHPNGNPNEVAFYVEWVSEQGVHPFYEASVPEFYNGSSESVDYIITIAYPNGRNGDPEPYSATTFVELPADTSFSAYAADNDDFSIRVSVIDNATGTIVPLGNVPTTVEGEYVASAMPDDIPLSASTEQGEPANYDDPILPQDPSEVTSTEFDGIAIEQVGWTLIENPQTQVGPDATNPQIANAESSDRENNSKLDQLLWQRSEDNQDARFDSLNNSQQARHQQRIMRDEARNELLYDGFSDLKSEFGESQLQGGETNEKLDEISETLDALGPDADEADSLLAHVNSTFAEYGSIGDWVATGRGDVDAKISEMQDMPSENPSAASVSASLGGSVGGNLNNYQHTVAGMSIDLNPFDNPEFAALAFWVREAIIWISTLFVLVEAIKASYQLGSDASKVPTKVANTEGTVSVTPWGVGVSVNLRAIVAFIAAIAIVTALLTAPAVYTAILETRIGGFSYSTLQSTPLDSAPPIVSEGLKFTDQFFPVVHVVGVASSYFVIHSGKWPGFLALMIVAKLMVL